MAIEHHSFGKGGGVQVVFESIDAETTVALGYTRDGVDLDTEQFFHVVKSDDYGGEEGPPADEQLLGAVVKCITELTKYERAEVDKLDSWSYSNAASSLGGTAGQISAPIGSFVRQDGICGVLKFVGPVKTLVFNTAFMRKKSRNVGTKNTTYMINWECWVDAADTQKLFEEIDTPSS